VVLAQAPSGQQLQAVGGGQEDQDPEAHGAIIH
jgi:hypothetical protein